MRTCEAAARRLMELAAGVVGAGNVERDLVDPLSVAAAGQIVVRTPSPAVLEQSLSPVSYWIEARLPVEIYATGSDATARAARLDVLVASLSAAVLADRSLGGLVADAEPAFDDEETLTADVGETLAGVAFAIRCQYESESPLG